MRIERLAGANGTAPARVHPRRDQRSCHDRPAPQRARRDPRALAIIVPGFLPTALVLDVGNVVHAQALAPEPRRRRRPRRGRRVPLAALQLRREPHRSGCRGDHRQGEALRGHTTGDYNETINKQSKVTVKINAASPTDTDNSDGGNPCQDHPVTTPPNPISPKGGIWTDVIVRESNIGTVAGTFG